MFDKLSEDQRQALNIVLGGHNLFMTDQGGTGRKNNCRLLSIFSAGEGGFGQCIGAQKGHLRTPGMIFFVQCPGLIFLAAC